MSIFKPGAPGVAILDGSTGYVLLQNGLPEDEMFKQIWSANALADERYHKLVVDTHKQYLDAGAMAITTNSYATQPTFYENAFGSGFEAAMLQHAELSARLAIQAVSEHSSERARPSAAQVLGSLPPLVESHRPDLFRAALKKRGEEYFRHHYRQLAAALLRGGVDALLFETLNCWDEARVGLEAMVELKPSVPIIVSFEGSIRDEALKPQPHLAPDLVRKVLDYKSKGLSIAAMGFNCAPPEDILKNLEVLRDTGMLKMLKEQGVGFAVYANMHEREVYDEGFEVAEVDASAVVNKEAGEKPFKRKKSIVRRKDLTECPDDPFSGHKRFTRRFVHDFGVCAVGGCCGCGPLGIEAIHKDLIPDVEFLGS